MKDKTVVITGATSGLGRATAHQLAQKGAFVVIIARSNTKANEVIKEIKKEGGKGQFIISDLSSMKDTKEAAYNSSLAYEQSKHLLTSFTYYLSRKLNETGITVNCIHPGFVKTALAQSDFPFPMNVIVPIVGLLIGETPEQAADTTVWLALSDEVKDINGEYVHPRKVKKSWPPTRDKNAQTRLYNVTQSMLGEWL